MAYSVPRTVRGRLAPGRPPPARPGRPILHRLPRRPAPHRPRRRATIPTAAAVPPDRSATRPTRHPHHSARTVRTALPPPTLPGKPKDQELGHRPTTAERSPDPVLQAIRAPRHRPREPAARTPGTARARRGRQPHPARPCRGRTRRPGRHLPTSRPPTPGPNAAGIFPRRPSTAPAAGTGQPPGHGPKGAPRTSQVRLAVRLRPPAAPAHRK